MRTAADAADEIVRLGHGSGAASNQVVPAIKRFTPFPVVPAVSKISQPLAPALSVSQKSSFQLTRLPEPLNVRVRSVALEKARLPPHELFLSLPEARVVLDE